MASDIWHAWRIAEAMELNRKIEEACEALFKRARKYADQLECLDPLRHDAEQAMASVILALSYDDNAQERLETS